MHLYQTPDGIKSSEQVTSIYLVSVAVWDTIAQDMVAVAAHASGVAAQARVKSVRARANVRLLLLRRGKWVWP